MQGQNQKQQTIGRFIFEAAQQPANAGGQTRALSVEHGESDHSALAAFFAGIAFVTVALWFFGL